MSYQAIDWVNKYSRSRRAARSVLLTIAHRVVDGSDTFPSISTIARDAGVNRATVVRCLKILKKLGELDWIVGGGRNRTNLYTLTLFDQQRVLFGSENRRIGIPFASEKGRIDASKQSQHVDTNKRERRIPRASHAEGDPRRELFLEFARQGFVTAHGGHGPTWSKKDYGQLARLLATNPHLSLDELRRRWTSFLSSSDPFTRSQGHSLAFFCSNLDRFIDGPLLAAPAGGKYGVSSYDRKSSGAIAPPAGKYSNRKPDAEFIE
jgi:hypothetical protein